ncbi:MAG: M1 family metallopeptidase [Bacteroidota bacterium]
MKKTLAILWLVASTQWVLGQDVPSYSGKFESIDRHLEPPSPYRTASGAPGAEYWQQRADYRIKAEIDEANDRLIGSEVITYYNNSPDDLKLLWIQLEQNVNRKGNEDFGYVLGGMKDSIASRTMQFIARPLDFPAGTDIQSVKDATGEPLDHIINNTMMRINLPTPLKSGSKMTFSIEWENAITDRMKFLLSREGYEYFPEDDNKVYLLGHWFPRMAVYNDTEGWQNQQFQRLGEFALEFGNYEVEMTVPADHIVAGTGALTNATEVMSKVQRDRMEEARKSFDQPVMIVTAEEALENQATKASGKKTWKFSAENVRDVAYASSRKFIWDAQAVKLPSNTVMAMSFYPNEGMPFWAELSTQAIKDALEVYSEATFDYPYPVAISVNTSNIGMEFPMISFNGGRPKNGQMSKQAKKGLINVVVHEVGHNWFPMIVSSDERKWMWMDEGLNTYLNVRTMAQRYPQYESTKPQSIVPFMQGDPNTLRPTMTNSDNDLLFQMGANYYQKPTVGLQMLRETIVGQELFDIAFKEYANRWKYKHPNPSDLFRTMEDETAVDLDWFWKGWFYTTETIDIDLAEVKWYQLRDEEVELENKVRKSKAKITGASEGASEGGFSDGPKPISVLPTPDAAYGGFTNRIDEQAMQASLKDKNIYELTFKNKGGLVMPIIIQWNYTDGTTEIEQLPAQIWRHNEAQVTRTFIKNKEVANITLDPNLELADVDLSNNVFPREQTTSRIDAFKGN